MPGKTLDLQLLPRVSRSSQFYALLKRRWRVIPDRVDESTVSERASANDAANLRGSVREGGMFG